MPYRRRRSHAAKSCSSLMTLRVTSRSRSVPASGAMVSVRWPPRWSDATRSSVRLSARSDEIETSTPYSSRIFIRSPIHG